MVSIPVIVLLAHVTTTSHPLSIIVLPLQRNGSSRSIDLNSEGCKIVAEPYMKHPLQDRWCLWFLEYDRSKSWEEMQNKVSTFDTVEDFWCLYDHIKNASELDDQNDYSVFKGNIRPMWEDPANNRGGRWILSAYKQRHEIDNYWLNTVSHGHCEATKSLSSILPLQPKLHFNCFSYCI